MGWPHTQSEHPMTDHFDLLREAVETFIATERQNHREGIHWRDLLFEERLRREKQFKEVYRHLDPSRLVCGSGPPSEDLVSALGRLYRACLRLKVWNLICDPREEGGFFGRGRPSWAVPVDLDAEAEEILGGLCHRVEQALGEVLATAAHRSGVVLRDRGSRPIVGDTEKDILTKAQYDVVDALLKAGDAGLSKDKLVENSDHADAVNVLKKLARSDPDGWGKVIQLPGKPGRGYRIV